MEEPNSDGLVAFDDWKQGNNTEQIKSIEDGLRQSLKEQSERLGKPIVFEKWRVYPTLDENRKILYYATDIRWDGDLSTTIKATTFDRRGYVTFQIMPVRTDLGSSEIENVMLDMTSHYQPSTNEGYSSFVSGDKVAAVGAVGVLAALLGVKYTKVAATTFFAIALVFLKKLWFLLLIPFVALKKLFSRKSGDEA